jgi:hypothetical protein
MKDLIIYHPGTGTVISLSDTVHLIDCNEVSEYVNEALDYGATNLDVRDTKAIRLDTYNMTNLFYGGAE